MKLILIIKYIILGIIQGFTEPIPISSSGHLLILKKIFNIYTNDINFEIIVNFGSFIAIAFLYRKEILNIIHDFIMYLKDKNKEYKSGFNYGLKIILASIPAGIIGLIFKDKIDIISNDIKLIGIALLITSVFLFIIKDFKGVKDKDNISFLDSKGTNTSSNDFNSLPEPPREDSVSSSNMNNMETVSVDKDPFEAFGDSIEISDNDLPF